MGIYDTFATNHDAETKGKLFQFPANADKTIPGFILARMGNTNPNYLKAIEHFGRVFKTELSLDILTEDVAFAPMLEVFLDTVLVGWENIQDREGKVIPYSKDTARKLLTELPDLYTVLRQHASLMANYRENTIKANGPN